METLNRFNRNRIRTYLDWIPNLAIVCAKLLSVPFLLASSPYLAEAQFIKSDPIGKTRFFDAYYSANYQLSLQLINELEIEKPEKLLLRSMVLRTRDEPIFFATPTLKDNYLSTIDSLKNWHLDKDTLLNLYAQVFQLESHYKSNQYWEVMQSARKAKVLIRDEHDSGVKDWELPLALSGYYKAYLIDKLPIVALLDNKSEFDKGIHYHLERLKGLTQMSDPFISTEAKKYLAHIYLRHQNEKDSAIQFIRPLVKSFELNPAFLSLLIEAELMNRESTDSIEIINIKRLLKASNPYYNRLGEVYQCIAQCWDYTSSKKLMSDLGSLERDRHAISLLSYYLSNICPDFERKRYRQLAKENQLYTYALTGYI